MPRHAQCIKSATTISSRKPGTENRPHRYFWCSKTSFKKSPWVTRVLRHGAVGDISRISCCVHLHLKHILWGAFDLVSQPVIPSPCLSHCQSPRA
eukprot:279798-Pyramimonas_sp.AAC.1